MRTLAIVLFLSTQLWAQDDLPISIGTGEFPPKVDVSTDIHELRELEIEAFSSGFEILRSRFASGQIQINLLLDQLSHVTEARLQIATSRQERVDVIRDSFANALTIWQRVFELKKVGQRGGEEDAEALSRVAVYRYRVMWLQEFNEVAVQDAKVPNVDSLQLPESLLKGELPSGLDSTDLGIVSNLHVKALEACLQIVKVRYERGSIPIAVYYNSIDALNDARLKVATTTQARLDVLKDSFINALLSWQRIHELQKAGQRGGQADDEAKARAVVFGYRARWLEEKFDTENQTGVTIEVTADSDGIPDQIGTGEFPPGLETANDVESVRKLQLEALKLLRSVLLIQLNMGSVNPTIIFNAQKDLALMELAFAQNAQQRLVFIEEAFIAVLKSWQRCIQLGKIGARGAEDEVIVRGMVYHYRVMWLMEKEKQTTARKSAASKEEATASDDQLDTHDQRPANTTSTICISDGSVVRNFRLRANQSDQRPLLMRRWIHRRGR